jgi:hypothetical protein
MKELSLKTKRKPRKKKCHYKGACAPNVFAPRVWGI